MCLDEPVFMAGPKPMRTEFGIHHRLESCALYWLSKLQCNRPSSVLNRDTNVKINFFDPLNLIHLHLWQAKLKQVYWWVSPQWPCLSNISPMFSIAAAFGNVHGVYKSGNVVLSPHLLAGHQVWQFHSTWGQGQKTQRGWGLLSWGRGVSTKKILSGSN